MMILRIDLISFVNLVYLNLVAAVFFPNMFTRWKTDISSQGNAGEPLILTPLLNDIPKAQNLSRVPFTEELGFESHAGFFTVDPKYDSNLYFWYFPSFDKRADAPVVLWLQGGPGGSSLFGLFTELGPLRPTKHGFKTRKYHWALTNHLIFIDNPVGTGFSYTKNDNGYCNNQDCIAKGLHSLLQQFFTLFPHLRNNNFYITGESYAGKYIPSLGMEIHHQNKIYKKSQINLKGMAIGNGYCDPINQMDYGNYLYQLGLIDLQERNQFEELQMKIQLAIKEKNWAKADILMDTLLDGELSNYSYFKNFTGFNYYYNFLMTQGDNTDMVILSKYLKDDKLRNAIHVGNLPFNSGATVQLHLALDILKSVAPTIMELLSHYRMLFYNGQLDIVVAYPLTENFLRNLLVNQNDYQQARRKIWKLNGEVVGYVKRAGNLTEILVRDAGHMVPHDQPKVALSMINNFIRNKF